MKVEDCTACDARFRRVAAYNLMPRLANPLPTPRELIGEVRGHKVVVDSSQARSTARWDDFVIVKSHTGGAGGTQWYRVDGDLLLQVELFGGRFDGCWGHSWDLGATVRIDDPAEDHRCSTILPFNDLADAVEWIGLLRPERGYPDLLPFPESVYRVPDARVRAASVSHWPPVLDGVPEDWSPSHGG